MITKATSIAQRIDYNKLESFDMIIAFFLVGNKNKKSSFFEETFLLADISINITHKMLFPTLSNIEINFTD